jgi:cell division septation protein DedD
MSDEGFHEIQLNGKQLVFLFMAATVVSVVIFLCGVMVGRGVRADRGPMDAAEATLSAAPAVTNPPPGTRPAGTDARREEAPAPPASQEPPATPDDDVYSNLMQGTPEKGETIKPKVPPKAESLPTASKSAETVAPTKADSKADTKGDKRKAAEAKAADARATAPARPDGGPTDPGTFAVQIAALRERSEADAIAKRLASKGYQAYVLLPAVGATPVYKVQVGRFKNKQDAEKTAARLKKEEQFSPWVTK